MNLSKTKPRISSIENFTVFYYRISTIFAQKFELVKKFYDCTWVDKNKAQF